MTMIFLLLLLPICVTSRHHVYHESREEQWINDIMDYYKDELRPHSHRKNEVLKNHNIDDETSHRSTENKRKDDGHLTEHSIQMPNVAPHQMDTYLCNAYKVPTDDRYIVKFAPKATMQIAHHMLLFGCHTPFKVDKEWNCREMQPVCAEGPQTIMYAWGRNAPSLKMPKDVGFHVGGKSEFKYLVLQVHYLNVSSFEDGKTTDSSGVRLTLDDRKKSRLAGIYLLANGIKPIPPHSKVFHVDNGCSYFDGPTFKPFRFRVHAHGLGVVITAYRVRKGQWDLIGRGDPQKPQAFYKSSNITIQPGDTLMGRCTYDSSKRDRWTNFGATHNDEMCNFYIMYSYRPHYEEQEGPRACQYPSSTFFNSYPTCSDVAQDKLESNGCADHRNFMIP